MGISRGELHRIKIVFNYHILLFTNINTNIHQFHMHSDTHTFINHLFIFYTFVRGSQ